MSAFARFDEVAESRNPSRLQMKTESHSLPSEENLKTVVLRLVPENDEDCHQITTLSAQLWWTDAVVTHSKIGESNCLSLIFHAKKN